MQGTNEPCAYHHKTQRLHLLTYSDDILAWGRKADVQWFFEQLGKRFSIKPPSYLSKSEMMDHLGKVFFETDAGTHLSMQSYVEVVRHSKAGHRHQQLQGQVKVVDVEPHH